MMNPIRYLIAVVALCAMAGAGRAVDRSVTTPEGLVTAIGSANPGDTISLAPGTYDFSTDKIRVNRPGDPGNPITVRASSPGTALLRFGSDGSFTVEGFLVSVPYWRFENLDIQGTCADDSRCEHAFHIVGDADFTLLINNRLHDFNAMVKGNISGGAFPDDVLLENNQLFNSAPRNTSNPVTPVDIVGGRRWVLRSNTIYDHAKAQGNQISYAAFFKGNSRDGIMEQNLVMCERFHTGGVRLGLSFGGGGTSPDSICEDGSCTPEHQNGTMRNNIIINCPADVGVYLNEALNSSIFNNTLYNTTGIDVRFGSSTAELRNNILNGRIRSRDGGLLIEGINLQQLSLADFQNWFTDPAGSDFSLLDGTFLVDQGENLAEVNNDFCNAPRNDGMNDLGAVEFSPGTECDTAVGGGRQYIFRDSFESGQPAPRGAAP